MLTSAMWVVTVCIASLVFGALCVRSHRLVLLWMIPEVLAVIFLGFLLFRAFTP